MIQVALRFDDPGVRSNREVEAAVLTSLRRHKVLASVAFVPFHQANGVRTPLLAEHVAPFINAVAEGLVEIVQHGHSHLRRPSTAAGPATEFAQTPAAEQWQLLAEGRSQLESVFGHAPTGFVPPWNQYDAATLRGLEDLGFHYLSAGWEGPLSSKLRMLPRSCHALELRQQVEALRRCGLRGAIVGVFHHYDFREEAPESAKYGLHDFERVVRWLAGQTDVRVCTMATMCRMQAPGHWRKAWNNRRLARKLPYRVRQHYPAGCLVTGSPIHTLGALLRHWLQAPPGRV